MLCALGPRERVPLCVNACPSNSRQGDGFNCLRRLTRSAYEGRWGGIWGRIICKGQEEGAFIRRLGENHCSGRVPLDRNCGEFSHADPWPQKGWRQGNKYLDLTFGHCFHFCWCLPLNKLTSSQSAPEPISAIHPCRFPNRTAGAGCWVDQ